MHHLVTQESGVLVTGPLVKVVLLLIVSVTEMTTETLRDGVRVGLLVDGRQLAAVIYEVVQSVPACLFFFFSFVMTTGQVISVVTHLSTLTVEELERSDFVVDVDFELEVHGPRYSVV